MDCTWSRTIAFGTDVHRNPISIFAVLDTLHAPDVGDWCGDEFGVPFLANETRLLVCLQHSLSSNQPQWHTRQSTVRVLGLEIG